MRSLQLTWRHALSIKFAGTNISKVSIRLCCTQSQFDRSTKICRDRLVLFRIPSVCTIHEFVHTVLFDFDAKEIPTLPASFRSIVPVQDKHVFNESHGMYRYASKYVDFLQEMQPQRTVFERNKGISSEELLMEVSTKPCLESSMNIDPRAMDIRRHATLSVTGGDINLMVPGSGCPAGIDNSINYQLIFDHLYNKFVLGSVVYPSDHSSSQIQAKGTKTEQATSNFTAPFFYTKTVNRKRPIQYITQKLRQYGMYPERKSTDGSEGLHNLLPIIPYAVMRLLILEAINEISMNVNCPSSNKNSITLGEYIARCDCVYTEKDVFATLPPGYKMQRRANPDSSDPAVRLLAEAGCVYDFVDAKKKDENNTVKKKIEKET